MKDSRKGNLGLDLPQTKTVAGLFSLSLWFVFVSFRSSGHTAVIDSVHVRISLVYALLISGPWYTSRQENAFWGLDRGLVYCVIVPPGFIDGLKN